MNSYHLYLSQYLTVLSVNELPTTIYITSTVSIGRAIQVKVKSVNIETIRYVCAKYSVIVYWPSCIDK